MDNMDLTSETLDAFRDLSLFAEKFKDFWPEPTTKEENFLELLREI